MMMRMRMMMMMMVMMMMMMMMTIFPPVLSDLPLELLQKVKAHSPGILFIMDTISQSVLVIMHHSKEVEASHFWRLLPEDKHDSGFKSLNFLT